MIYLDHAATTPVSPNPARVAVRMMTEVYGNPSSGHAMGTAAHGELERARAALIAAAGGGDGGFLFTSGATEANNTAIYSAVRGGRGRGRHIVSTRIEHPSVLNPLKQLEQEGCEVTLVSPGSDGRVTEEAIAAAVRPDTVLIAVMMVNNETGQIQPVENLRRLAASAGGSPAIHIDGVQALGRLPFSADRLDADTISFSGHKCGAPKGVGGLYIRRGFRLRPLIRGGGQEGGIRPGTENLPAIAAWGAAADELTAGLRRNFERIRGLHDYAKRTLSEIPGLVINPCGDSPYILNFSLPPLPAEVTVNHLAQKGIIVSSGAACAGGRTSRVLEAMGIENKLLKSAVRISFGPDSDSGGIDGLRRALEQAGGLTG